MKIASRQDLAQAFSSHVIREGPIDEKYKGIAAIFSFQQITQTNRQWVSREQMWPAQLPQATFARLSSVGRGESYWVMLNTLARSCASNGHQKDLKKPSNMKNLGAR